MKLAVRQLSLYLYPCLTLYLPLPKCELSILSSIEKTVCAQFYMHPSPSVSAHHHHAYCWCCLQLCTAIVLLDGAEMSLAHKVLY